MKKYALTVLLVFVFGCTSHFKNLSKVASYENERVRELTQAARVANQIGRDNLSKTNYAKATVAYDLSDDFLRREQNIVGLPVEDQSQVVKSLLDENKKLRAAAKDLQDARELEETEWRRQREQYLSALQAMGQKYEEEHNKSIIKRLFAGLGFTGTILLIVGICILCPAAIPVFTHFAGFVVSKVPALASALGIVSKKCLDQVIRGIQKGKDEISKNPTKNPLEVLDTELSKSMDENHKILVRARKAKVVAPI
jgi:hypothetical protein